MRKKRNEIQFLFRTNNRTKDNVENKRNCDSSIKTFLYISLLPPTNALIIMRQSPDLLLRFKKF